MKNFTLVIFFLVPFKLLAVIEEHATKAAASEVDAIINFNFSGYKISLSSSTIASSTLLSKTISNTQTKKDHKGRYFIECDRSLVKIAHYFLIHKKLIDKHDTDLARQAADFFGIDEIWRYLNRNYEPVA